MDTYRPFTGQELKEAIASFISMYDDEETLTPSERGLTRDAFAEGVDFALRHAREKWLI